MHSNSFRDRITALKGRGPEKAATHSSPQVLSERLARLRVQASPAPASQAPVVGDDALAKILQGQVVAPGVVLVEHDLSGDDCHGLQRLSCVATAEPGVLFGDSPPPEQLLFIDTETTGLAGGTGTVAFLIGVLRLEGANLRLRQYLLTAFGGERAMLEHLAQWLRGGETLVTYNGKSFDAPLLATRHRLCGLADPLNASRHWDLVHPTRRAFAGRWPDCRLATAEQRLLGFLREDDLSGAEVPQVWFEYVRFGLADRIPAVLQHNYWDLLSLVVLLPALVRAFSTPESEGADALGVARHALQGGDEDTALRHLECQRGLLDERGLLELARLHRRRGEWPRAVVLWEELAQRDCVEALEHLAKYHEHALGDHRRALVLTERLLVLAPRLAQVEQRHQRLLRKCGLVARPD